MLIIAINENGVNTPIKRQRLGDVIKRNINQMYTVFKKFTSNNKHKRMKKLSAKTLIRK
jgi:hypothetical protein